MRPNPLIAIRMGMLCLLGCCTFQTSLYACVDKTNVGRTPDLCGVVTRELVKATRACGEPLCQRLLRPPVCRSGSVYSLPSVTVGSHDTLLRTFLWWPHHPLPVSVVVLTVYIPDHDRTAQARERYVLSNASGPVPTDILAPLTQ